MFELVDLRAFARIAELKSVTAAARALKSPKSSVSRSLARLEAAIGTALVERSTRYLRLTDAGMLLHPHALRILNEVNEAANVLGSLKGVPSGTLRVNAPFTFAVGLLAPMLPAFIRRYPDVRVVLDIDNRWVNAMTEDADLVIRVGALADSSLIARRLVTSQLLLCCSPAYLAARGTPSSVAELNDHQLIAWTERPVKWTFWDANGKSEHVDVRHRTVVPEPAALQVLLVGGAGIGRLPDFMASAPIAKGELVRVLPELRPDTVDVHALYSSHRSLSAKVRVFIDALVVHLENARPAPSAR